MIPKDLERPPTKCYACGSKNLKIRDYNFLKNDNRTDNVKELRCIDCDALVFEHVKPIKG